MSGPYLLAIDAGTIDHAAGDGGLGSDGRIDIVARSRLRLHDGSTTLGAAAAISGKGELEVAPNATLAVPGGVEVHQCSLSFRPRACASG